MDETILTLVTIFCLINASLPSLLMIELAKAHSGDVILSGWTPYPPTIDGVFHDEEWYYATPIQIVITTTEPEEINLAVYAMNDAEYLYLCIKFYDEDPEVSDAIFLYFDENHDGALTNLDEDARAINGEGEKWDGYWEGDWGFSLGAREPQNFDAKISWRGDRWEMECRISLNSHDRYDLNHVELGSTLGFEVVIHDRFYYSGREPKTAYGGWPEPVSGYHGDSSPNNPNNWADIVLSAEGVTPKIEVTNVLIDPSPAIMNQYFVVSCQVKNTGNASALEVYAMITVPSNITFALGQGAMNYLGTIEPEESKNCIWTLRGITAGTYMLNVTLSGSNTPEVKRSISIQVIDLPNKAPVAVIRVNSTVVYVNESVTFDASNSFDPDGKIIYYFFDFGDGNSTGWIRNSTVRHKYIAEGNYNVTLFVMDDFGAISVSDAQAFVEVIVIPEFSSVPALAILMVVTLIATTLCFAIRKPKLAPKTKLQT